MAPRSLFDFPLYKASSKPDGSFDFFSPYSSSVFSSLTSSLPPQLSSSVPSSLIVRSSSHQTTPSSPLPTTMSDQFSKTSTNITQSNMIDMTSFTGNMESLESFFTSISGNVRDDPWIRPLMAVPTTTIGMIVLLEVLVLSKAFRRTSRSPTQLFLGQILLLGLTFGSMLGFSFVFNPSKIICALNHAAVGIVYAFIFGTLLVKCIFLLTLHSGTYLPLTYQLLLLFFIVCTQVAIDVQWLMYSPSDIRTIFGDHSGSQSDHRLLNSTLSINTMSGEPNDDELTSSRMLYTDQTTDQPVNRTVCSQKFSSFTYTLIYNMFLIGVLTILAFRIRRHRENYREALFITISVLCTILVWLAWITGAIIFREIDRPAFIGFGLVINCALIFIIMYIPKAVQIVKLRWYTHHHLSNDYNNHDSSQSLCAQSFVHIKPSATHHHLHHHNSVSLHANNQRDLPSQPPQQPPPPLPHTTGHPPPPLPPHTSHHHHQVYSNSNVHPAMGTMRSTMDTMNGWTLNDHLLPLKTHDLHGLSSNFIHKSIVTHGSGRQHLFMGTAQRNEKNFDHLFRFREKERYMRPNIMDPRLN
ncbi:uncharacterized protein LOC141850605 [Brevipalpus obovatus]|uniref:uncharacterized protein LOC141850605 n=1 Tax=Brevipalpus obovatus TaxID=246614 RepID=UPI003D9EEB19